MNNKGLQQAASRKRPGMIVDNGSKQKVIPRNKASHLTQVWELAVALPDSKSILKIPL